MARKMLRLICVTGTPGSGKSTLTRRLAISLHCDYVDLNEALKKAGLAESFDGERKCWVVNTDKMEEVADRIIRKYEDAEYLILDSHLSHDLPNTTVDLVIITVCDIEMLAKRLRERGYDEKKVQENVQAEIFQVCAEEAKENGHTMMVVDTTEEYRVEDIVSQVRGMLD